MLHKTRLGLAAAVVSLGLVANTTPATALPDWRTTPTSYENPRARTPKVIGLRYATHENFDRVVIDIRGRRPGYRISYTKRLAYDGSGKTVPLKGRKKMSLTLTPAYAHRMQDGSGVYEGPRLEQVDFPTLRGVAFTGDFEGQVSFGFSTDRRAPYRIFTLTEPNRIVVDWKH